MEVLMREPTRQRAFFPRLFASAANAAAPRIRGRELDSSANRLAQAPPGVGLLSSPPEESSKQTLSLAAVEGPARAETRSQWPGRLRTRRPSSRITDTRPTCDPVPGSGQAAVRPAATADGRHLDDAHIRSAALPHAPRGGPQPEGKGEGEGI